MCGIAGYFGKTPLGAESINAVMHAIGRRGPDARQVIGWHQAERRAEPAAASQLLFHTRLSIRDLAPEANQPMANDNATIWICYNGEVYGWEPERKALENSGVVFRTQSDTEFILRAYEAWGMDAMLPRLRGMFSFAILDWTRGQLHLARDRMGLKPLLYHHDPVTGTFAFGSLVRAVLPMLTPAQREFDPQALDAYLAHRTIPAPMTIMRQVRRLENAHRLEFDLTTGALRKRVYWTPASSGADARESLDEAVRLRTVADRPVGVFLSGGIDSSVVASRLSEQGYNNIHTFTAGFDDAAFDESAVARRSAESLNMPNTRIALPDDVSGNFARIIEDLDEPFADPSSFPTWSLAREVSKSVKVVLCGDGGDELFAGYKRYGQHLRSAWRRNLPVFESLRPPPAFPVSKSARIRYEGSIGWVDAYALRFAGFSAPEREALQPDLGRRPPHHWRTQGDLPTDPIACLLEIDRLNYLPEYILRKADLATMAHGLEGRAPLLDHHFVEAVYGLERTSRFSRPPKRWLVEQCAPCQSLGLLDMKKRGFNPSVGGMLRAGLQHRIDGFAARLSDLSGGQLRASALDSVAAAWRTHGGYTEQLLQLLMLEECLQQLRTIAGSAR